MEEYYARKEAFLQALRECEIYRDYQQKKEALDRDPEKKRLVNDLRKRNFQFRNSQYTANYNEVLEQMAADMEEMREDKVIDDFLAAELALCQLVQELLDGIMGSVDMDMDFL